MNKYAGIELLRGLSAIWVLLFHYKQVYPDTVFSYGMLDPLISKGGLGVEVFFVLSGFIMQIRYKAKFGSTASIRDYRNYFIKRFARIWPLHAVCTIIMVFGAYLSYFFFSTNLDGTRFNLLNITLSLLLASFYIESVIDINMPAWTLSAEMFAYAMLPIVILISNLKAAKHLVWALVIPFSIYLSHTNFEAGYRLLCGYAVGVFFAEYFHKIAPTSVKFIFAISTYLAYVIFDSYVIFMLFIGSMVTILCLMDDFISNRPSLHFVCMWLGKLSFPLYIVHWPVRTYLRTVVEMSDSNISNGTMIFLYTMVSLFLAYALHLLIEEPSRKYIITRFVN